MAIRAIDPAGNVSQPRVVTYDLDTTPPAAPEVVAQPAAFDPDDTPTWAFTATGTIACRLDDGDWFPSADEVTADFTGAADGVHSFAVRGTDAVGNVGAVTTVTYTLDRSAPAVPAFLTAPLSPSNGTTPAWTFTSEAGTTTTCSLDYGPWVVCTGTYVAELDGEDDGAHVLRILSTDAARNVSPTLEWTYELDRTPPSPASVTGPGPVGNDPTPEWTIVAGAGDRAESALDGGPFAACGALFTADFTGAEWGHDLHVRVVDAAGNLSETTTLDYRLDTSPPNPPLITAEPTDGGWAWGLGGDLRSMLECSFDGGPWFPCASGGVPARSDVSRFDARARDDAGNYSAVTTWTAPVAEAEPLRTVVSASEITNSPTPVAPAAIAPTPATTVTTAVGTAPPPFVLGTEVPLPPGSGWLDVGEEPRARGEGRTAVAAILQAAVQRTTVPLILVLLVIGFIAVQNQIDRRDPKLASAPLREEPEYMEFR